MEEYLAEIRAEWAASTRQADWVSKAWKNFTANDKKRFVHSVAQQSQTDKLDYFTPYLRIDIDDILKQRRWSVEHVVPRSKCQAADGNVWNFVEVDRSENSRRGAHPLKLWPDGLHQLHVTKFQTWLGVKHYAPPSEERARLARKWLYTHVTYSGQCKAMSDAQRLHLSEIIALAKHDPPGNVEINVATQLQNLTGTRNPLILDDTPSRWYDDSAWRALLLIES